MQDEYSILFDKYLQLSDEKRAMEACVFKAISDSFAEQKLDILDLGCGDGNLSSFLANERHHVSAIDIRNSFSGANVDFECVGVFDYSTDKKFDLIIMAYFLWELPISKWDEIFDKCKKLLKKEGKIFVVDVCNEGKFDNVFVEFDLAENIKHEDLKDPWDSYCENKFERKRRVNFKSSMVSTSSYELYAGLAFFFKDPSLDAIYRSKRDEFINFFENRKSKNGLINLTTTHFLDVI